MVGGVSVILCKRASGGVEVYSVHRTFDGAKEEIDTIYDYYNRINGNSFVAKAGINGKLAVFTKDGKPHKEFIVNQYPLDK